MQRNKQKPEAAITSPTVKLFRRRPQDLSLIDSMIQEIVLNELPEETPAARLKQFAIIAVFHALKARGIPLSLTTLTEMTGMTRKSAQEVIDPLVARGLLVETWGRGSHGRGKAKLFHFAKSLLQAE